MGMTLCNLHMLQDVFREESAGPNDTVRRVSTGWASLLPELPEGYGFSIKKEDPNFQEALRLLKFLQYFLGISTEDLPKNSICREFVGGSCFEV